MNKYKCNECGNDNDDFKTLNHPANPNQEAVQCQVCGNMWMFLQVSVNMDEKQTNTVIEDIKDDFIKQLEHRINHLTYGLKHIEEMAFKEKHRPAEKVIKEIGNYAWNTLYANFEIEESEEE